MKRLLKFLRHYKLFGIALITVVVGLGLQFTHHKVAVHWLLSIVAILELIPLIIAMWHDVQSGKYGIDILAATAIIASVLLGEYWAAIIIVVMLTGGEALEHYAQHRAKSELNALLAHAPQTAYVLRKGKTIQIKVDEIKVGDKLIIKAGEVVPADAQIIEGRANFDESSLTGESLPQAKKTGDTLLSGSINIDGPVTAKALATAADSHYQQIIKLVRSASHSQAPFVRLADRYSLPFTVLAYAIAVTVWIISGQAIRFLEVIVVATPCPLLLAAPIAVISGMARASRYGIIVKTGGALERLAEAKTFAFDKTGTLTAGLLKVNSVVAYAGYKKTEILSLAAGLEQNSNHLVARAIVESARRQKLKATKAKHVKEISGRGLEAQIKGQKVIVGRLSLLQQNDVKLPARFKISDIKQTVVYVAIDGHLDIVKGGIRERFAELRKMGIRTVMVTGDNQTTAKAIAKQLAISTVHAETLPVDKLRVMEAIKERPVAFIGDGVNDAPVLTAADIGIALGARGSTAASESADMVIMLDDISRVATAREIAGKTFGIARQSILIGIAMSIGLMLVFSTGKFTPLEGAVIQEAVDVFVIFNALRAHFIKVSDIN